MPDVCEWNPLKNELSWGGKVDGDCPNMARWIVGHDGKYRLCESCAALSQFKKYKVRSPVKPEFFAIADQEPIHGWFELSYAQYLTIPRSVLQSMPTEWQQRFVQCLNELDDMIDWRPEEGTYRVELHELKESSNGTEWGRKLYDRLQDYQRGRRRIPLKSKA